MIALWVPVAVLVVALVLIALRVSGRHAATVPPMGTEDAAQESEAIRFGATCGSLTQVGDLWVDLNLVIAVDLDPEGPGVELSDGGHVDINVETAAVFRAYLDANKSTSGEVRGVRP